MKFAIDHMNKHHQKELMLLAKYISKKEDIQNIHLENIDKQGLHIKVNHDEMIIFPFDPKDDINDIKNLIISKVQFVKSQMNQVDTETDLNSEIQEFKKSLYSIIIATIDKNHLPHSSYAVYVEYKDDLYIYVSQVADHYENIKHRPLEIMFLEDESRAVSEFLRRRLRYKVKATFIQREHPDFNAILDIFESQYKETIKMIRKFTDFDLVKLELQEGRYVKGFGQAYTLTLQDKNSWEIKAMKAGSQGQEHNFPENY